MLRVKRVSARITAWIRRSWLEAWVLGAICASGLALRYLVLLRYPAPPGADYGNYLTNLHAMFGDDVTGGGVQYPAFFLLYLAALVRMMGEIPALQFSGPFLAGLTGLPMYLFLRRYVPREYALLGSAMMVFSEGISEMIGWGGNPTLLGIFFGTLFLTFLYDTVAKGTWRARLLAAASFALLAGSHQVSLAFFGFVGILFLSLFLALTRRIPSFLSGLSAIALGILGAAPFIPFYLSLGQTGADFLPTASNFPSAPDVGFIFGWLFREALIVWIPIAVISIVGYARLRSQDIVGFCLGVTLLVSPLVLAFTLMAVDPVRAFYYLYLGMIPGALIFVERALSRAKSIPRARGLKADWNSAGVAVVIGVALFLVSTSYARMNSATDWYYVASTDVLDGLSWIQSNAPIGSVVATNGPMKYGNDELVGCMWGWWIEGYARRPSLCTANPTALAWKDQVLMAADADRAFYGTNVVETGVIRVGDFAPFGTEGNPLVAANFGFGYTTFASFSDAGMAITWKPSQSASDLESSPSQMPIHSANVTTDQTRAVFRYGADGPNLTVERIVDTSQSSPVVWVNYTVVAIGVLHTVEVKIFGGSRTIFGGNDPSIGSIAVSNVPGFRTRIQGNLKLTAASSELARMDISPHPANGNPAAIFSFAPNQTSFSASFAVMPSVDPPPAGGDLRLYNAISIFDNRRVQYALLDRADVRHVTWCAQDAQHWREVYSNEGVVVFERTNA